MLGYKAIEAHIVGLIQGAVDDAETVKSYGGEFSPDSFGQVPLRYPAVFVNIQGLSSEMQSNTGSVELEIFIHVASHDLSGEQEARHGVYDIMEQVRDAVNQQAVPDKGMLKLESEDVIGYSKVMQTCVMRGIYRLKAQT